MKNKTIPEIIAQSEYRFEPSGKRRLSLILKWVAEYAQKEKRNLKILDIGCGIGNIALALGNLGHTVLGIDIDKETVQEAKKKTLLPNVDFQRLSIEALGQRSTGENQFDVIIASEVLEHLSHPEMMVSQIGKILKKEGILIASVPNGFCLEELIRRFLVKTTPGNRLRLFLKQKILKQKQVQTATFDSSHQFYFSLNSFLNLLRKEGFRHFYLENSTIFFRQAYYLFFRLFLPRNSPIFSFLDQIDLRLSSKLPLSLGSGWSGMFNKNEGVKNVR